jgi:hypothetical protein
MGEFNARDVFAASDRRRKQREQANDPAKLIAQFTESLQHPPSAARPVNDFTPAVPQQVEQPDLSELADLFASSLSSMLSEQLLTVIATLSERSATATIDPDSLKELGRRLAPITPLSPSAVGLKGRAGEQVDPATEDTLRAIQRGVTDFETRLDYGARLDDSPVYVGRAEQGTQLSAKRWTIQHFTYDANDRATRIQVRSGAWANRAELF